MRGAYVLEFFYFFFFLLYLFGAGPMIFTSILNWSSGGVGGGGCFGVGELEAAHHLISFLQLLDDGNCQIQAPMIFIIVH